MAAADSALASATKLAPHFSIVSLVPAAVLTVSMTLVVGARPWTGDPSWPDAFAWLATPTFSQLAGGLVLVAVVALALHPLQFPLIQLLEGYWGRSPILMSLASQRIQHHKGVKDALEMAASGVTGPDPAPAGVRRPAGADPAWWQSESQRLQNRYPVDPQHVLPTRLGNVLRRYEQSAGNPYGLSLITTAPMLLLVGEEADVEYVRDQRTQLDLATAMCAVCGILTLGYTVLLLPAGWWLMLAGLPYLLTYAFYRGSCSVAEEYGTALYALMDLNRTALYQRLRVDPGNSLQHERDNNPKLMAALRDRTNRADLDLTDPPPPATATPPTGAAGPRTTDSPVDD